MRDIRSFVVRIYRRDAQGVSGVVEDVRTGCVHTFHSPDDLWEVLASRVHEPPREGKAK